MLVLRSSPCRREEGEGENASAPSRASPGRTILGAKACSFQCFMMSIHAFSFLSNALGSSSVTSSSALLPSPALSLRVATFSSSPSVTSNASRSLSRFIHQRQRATVTCPKTTCDPW